MTLNIQSSIIRRFPETRDAMGRLWTRGADPFLSACSRIPIPACDHRLMFLMSKVDKSPRQPPGSWTAWSAARLAAIVSAAADPLTCGPESISPGDVESAQHSTPDSLQHQAALPVPRKPVQANGGKARCAPACGAAQSGTPAEDQRGRFIGLPRSRLPPGPWSRALRELLRWG